MHTDCSICAMRCDHKPSMHTMLDMVSCVRQTLDSASAIVVPAGLYAQHAQHAKPLSLYPAGSWILMSKHGSVGNARYKASELTPKRNVELTSKHSRNGVCNEIGLSASKVVDSQITAWKCQRCKM